MPATIIESVLTRKLDTVLLFKWLNNESIEDAPEDCILYCCSRSEFVSYFLTYLRTQTDSVLQTNSNAVQLLQQQATPEKILSKQKHRRSVSDPTSDTDRITDSLSAKTNQLSHESPSKDRKKSGRKVKTKLFPDDKSKDLTISSDESRLSGGVNRLIISSTPIKNGYKNEYPSLVSSPVTPNLRSFRDSYERCDTPRLSHRHSRSQEKNISLGDFLVNVQPKSSKKKRNKNVSDENDTDTKMELDLSNSEIFPEIGARKSSSLRSERRRIKPTNLDKSSSQKSFSLNSFNAETFQQPSPLALENNAAFKEQKIQPKEFSKSFEVERSILKQERHKLMEKFNILNTSTSQSLTSTPQIKVTQKECCDFKQSYVTADINKVVFKDQIDILAEIYDTLLKNNLILSLNIEIYFLISILLSKQYEEDFTKVESQLNEKNISECLLKSIHNSTYFVVKSLWYLRTILEVILDKNSLKILGENKKIRSFYPDLAKFLLNSYGLKVEAENNQEKIKSVTENRASNGVICFNFETDNAENFPSVLSFQNFKKQRDMFYEILRWYQDTQTSGGTRTTFKARIKTLISSGPTAANHAHLAALFTAHMIAECLPPTVQESKLSKLQRRLTCPTAPESHRLPHFTAKETFYKEFIMYAENECFRVHLRDAFASEIIALDSTTIVSESYNQSDISREFLQLSKKLCLLSKFLGYLTSLPYSQVPTDFMTKTGALANTRIQKEVNYTVPKEKVLQNNIALRNFTQPCIDLRGILINSDENGRLCITLPWIIHYLSMLDYTSLRLKYYQNLLKLLFNIYETKLKMNPISLLKKNTVIFLKSILGWLFGLPHFPQEFFYESKSLNVSVASENTIDFYDLINESILFELCPFLRDVNVLLSTCKISNDQKEMGSFRHITPVSLSLNAEDRIRNKEKELQARLEEEFLKTQPSSTRRVLELVMERVTSGTVKELTAQILSDFRKKTREKASNLVCSKNGENNETLIKSLEALYASQLQQLRGEALEAGVASIKRRAGAALAALLPSAPSPLLFLAVKGCVNRLNKWLNDNWSTTAVLCKDLEEEMKTLITLGDAVTGTHQNSVDLTAMLLPSDKFDAVHVSAAAAVINLKEHICLLLDYDEVPDSTSLLATCTAACSPTNLFSRPPTQRAILQLSVDYCIVFVSRKPKQVNDEFLNKLHALWNTCCPDRKKHAPQELLLPERRPDLSPELRNFEDDERPPTPVSDEDDAPITPDASGSNMEKLVVIIDCAASVESKSVPEQTKSDRQEQNTLLEFFDRILCPRNIVLLGESRCKASAVWEALATVLVFLLKNDYLSEDSLTEQCLAVYRQDWPQSILENLSTCMKSVSSRWSRASTGKFTLFLDFLAEYCGDMDYEPLD